MEFDFILSSVRVTSGYLSLSYQGQQEGGGQEVACHFHLCCRPSKTLRRVSVQQRISHHVSVGGKEANLSDKWRRKSKFHLFNMKRACWFCRYYTNKVEIINQSLPPQEEDLNQSGLKLPNKATQNPEIKSCPCCCLDFGFSVQSEHIKKAKWTL